MSIWTKDDVDKLRPERGGSNENARRKYFARYGNAGRYPITDQQMLLALVIALTLVMTHRYDERRLPRPQKGDDHTVWKDFIKQVYIDKRFCGDAGKWPCMHLCMGWRSGLLLPGLLCAAVHNVGILHHRRRRRRPCGPGAGRWRVQVRGLGLTVMWLSLLWPRWAKAGMAGVLSVPRISAGRRAMTTTGTATSMGPAYCTLGTAPLRSPCHWAIGSL
jgi:hypothetical protein